MSNQTASTHAKKTYSRDSRTIGLVSKAKPIVEPVVVKTEQKLTLDDTSSFPSFATTGNVKKQVHPNWTKDTSTLKKIPERHASPPATDKKQETMLSLSIGSKQIPSLSIPKIKDGVTRRFPSPKKQSSNDGVFNSWVENNIAYLEEEYEKMPGHSSFEEFSLSSYNLAEGKKDFLFSSYEKFEPFEEEEYDEIPYENVEDEDEDEEDDY